jgi:hypothetical protein
MWKAVRRLLELAQGRALAVPPVQLGRWGRTRDDAALAYKVTLANHDHCGPCGRVPPKSAPSTGAPGERPR